MAVFVQDQHGHPLMPCTERRARLLLERGRAKIHRVVPFVIRLTDRSRETCAFQPLRIKLDPGSKSTGLAVVRDTECVDRTTGEIERGAAVLNLFELIHRGRQISEALTARRSMRRRRRGNLRYRAPRFNNRTRQSGWLPPSLRHRVDTTLSWVKRLRRWAPITDLSCESVRFDLQALENPEISGVEYQHGTLFGYEIREYLLLKWGHTCGYCGKGDRVLNIDHIDPRARSGSNRVSNLAIACVDCNQKKGAQPIESFVKDKARLAQILAQAKRPLRDAAAVNSTRHTLAGDLRGEGLAVELASGGRTKYNRVRLNLPKTHALDAVCVGQVDEVTDWQRPTLMVKSTGRGSYSRTRLDKYGFPRGYLMRRKDVRGFRTGDLVCARVPTGKKTGTHTGRVAIRESGYFNIQTGATVVQGISHKHCELLQRADGYGYSWIATTKGEAGTGRAAHDALSLPGHH